MKAPLVGAATLSGSGDQTISPGGIGSQEAFGTLSVQPGPVTLSPTGIASAEAFGSATVAHQTIVIVFVASTDLLALDATVDLVSFPTYSLDVLTASDSADCIPPTTLSTLLEGQQ